MDVRNWRDIYDNRNGAGPENPTGNARDFVKTRIPIQVSRMGNGGSGIVVLKIPRAYSAVFSPGCTVANSTSVADYFVYSVTATSTTSETVKFVRN